MKFSISENEVENIALLQENKLKYLADKRLIEKENGNILYEKFENYLSDGVYNVIKDNIKYPVFVKTKKNSRKLYVLLSGGRTPGKTGFLDTLPRFKRWSFYNYFDGHVIVFDDPMYSTFPDLLVGWFYGTKDRSYCLDICEISKVLAEKLGASEICYYGSSSGGYAALLCSTFNANSTAIAINPQLNLRTDWYKVKFKKITGIDLDCEDSFLRNKLSNRIKRRYDSRFYIVQNLTDTKTIKEHFLPFCKDFGIDAQYGIIEKDNLTTWVYNAPGGHIAYEDSRILTFILNLAFPFFDRNLIYEQISDLWYTIRDKKQIK